MYANGSIVYIITPAAVCPNPPAIVNGMRTFTGNSVGDTATYTCDSAFELIGNATTTCIAAPNGTSAVFSPAQPVCRRECILHYYRNLPKIRPWAMNFSGYSKRGVGLFSSVLVFHSKIGPPYKLVYTHPDITRCEGICLHKCQVY